ncbi:hypothetical protein M0804_013060, partial [Polistes exclamans]
CGRRRQNEAAILPRVVLGPGRGPEITSIRQLLLLLLPMLMVVVVVVVVVVWWIRRWWCCTAFQPD